MMDTILIYIYISYRNKVTLQDTVNSSRPPLVPLGPEGGWYTNMRNAVAGRYG